MKKILTLILVLTMVLTMAACGGSEAPAGTPGTNEGNTNTPADSTPAGEQVGQTPDAGTEETYSFDYKGVKLELYADAAPVIAALGEPTKYSESASCAFDGLDKNYYYGNLDLDTYPEGDKDRIYGWWFADDTLTTAEGIYIGATQADVEAAYGTDSFNGTNAYVIKKGEGNLTIIMKDGVVNSIQYAIILK